MKKTMCFVLILVAVLGLSLLPGLARATVILDFNMDANHPAGVSISYAGGANPLIGVNIGVDNVTGKNTPLNDLVLRNIIGGILTFTSGNFLNSGAGFWNFGTGGVGSIKVTGGVDLNNNGIIDGTDVPLGTTLLIGQITSAQVDQGGGNFKVTIASFVDAKDRDLMAFYGLFNLPFWGGNFNLSFNAVGDPPGGFTSTDVLSGDIVNSPVPEPATMLLLGSGLVGIGITVRKRFGKKS